MSPLLQGKFADRQEKQSPEKRLTFKIMTQTNAWIFIWVGLICVGVLAGCSPAARSNLPPAVEAAEATIMPVNSTPQPTFTQKPTETIQPTATSTTTAAPTATATPTAEFRVGSTRISEIDGMELAYVPAGSFIMGDNEHTDERPEHEVMLDAFWMDKYEVSNAQYQQCIDSGACVLPKNLEYFNVAVYQNHPVVYVNWYHAEAYCIWAGRRLPSEAEWEKASRGPNGRAYPWGDATPASELVNFQQEVDTGTSEVGTYPDGASEYGMFDMSGNVSEWVNDWYAKDYYASETEWINPQGPSEGTEKVLKGGSWIDTELALRAANRSGFNAVGSDIPFMEEFFGFRCALSAKSP